MIVVVALAIGEKGQEPVIPCAVGVGIGARAPVVGQGIDEKGDVMIEEKEENEKRSLRSIERAGVDGAIISSFYLGSEHLRSLVESNIPVVFWRGETSRNNDLLIDRIFVDNVSMAKTAVKLLLKKEHTRIGMIAGLKGTPPRQARIQGFCEARRSNDN